MMVTMPATGRHPCTRPIMGSLLKTQRKVTSPHLSAAVASILRGQQRLELVTPWSLEGMGGAPFAGLLALAKLSKAPLQLLALYVLSGKTIAHIAQDLKHFVQKTYEFLGRRWRGWVGPAAWLPTLRVSLSLH